MKRLLTHPLVWRLGVALYVVCLSGLLVAFFSISSREVETAAYVHGPSKFVVGEQRAMRGRLIDPQNGQPIEVTDLVLALKHEEGSSVLERRARAAGDVTFAVDVPETLRFERSYRLSLSAQREGDGEGARFETSAPVSVSAREEQAPALNLPQPSARRPEARGHDLLKTGAVASEGEVALELVEPRAIVPNGLPSSVTIRATRRQGGEPLECEVRFATIKGLVDGEALPSQVRTDALGMARVRLTAVTAQSWELEAECAPASSAPMPLYGTARVQLDVTASQFALQVPDALIDQASTASARLDTIHRQGAALVDLYRASDEAWLWAGTFGYSAYSGVVGVPLEAGMQPGLYRIQVHADLYDSGFAWDSAYLYKPNPPKAPNRTALEQAISELLELLERAGERGESWGALNHGEGERWRGLSGRGKRQLFETLLKALPARYQRSEPILNSFEQDERELKAWKQSARSDLLALIGLALLVGLALLALVVLWGIDQARRRQRLYDEVSEELDLDGAEGEEESMEAMGARARRRKIAAAMIWVQGAVVCGTLAIFAACIWLMIRYI